MSPLRRTSLLLQLAACVALSMCEDNIDTVEPIYRPAPSNLNAEGYFGHTVILHHVQAVDPTTSSFSDYLSSARIMVGAPNGTLGSFAVPNPGVVYQCPIGQNDNCDKISGGGNAVRLFDSTSNNFREEKSGQFMGVSLASAGNIFMACAHRYVYFQTDTNIRNLFGRCFISDRAFSSFGEIQPCVVQDLNSFDVCQAGTSAAIAKNSNGFNYVFVGGPGSYGSRGAVMRREVNLQSGVGRNDAVRIQIYSRSSIPTYSYQGYTTIKGHFRDLTSEDLATSVPRRNNYFGTVNIVRNSPNMEIVAQNMRGSQMGEYYGFSLAGLNLGGDGLHELLVGAPLYSDRSVGPETGRVYIYRNIAGTMVPAGQLIGVKSYSRFGHAMAALGDISGDGFDDVAIGAPFRDEDGGKVYIYHSSTSQLINPVPQQILSPKSLNLLPAQISSFQSFGTSLASGVDVDGNTYNDLAIGSYLDQSVVLLRVRPLLSLQTTMTATPSVVNLLDNSVKKTFDGSSLTPFDLKVCLQYSGRGLASSYVMRLNLTAEKDRLEQGLQRRLFLGQTSPSIARVSSLILSATINAGSSPQCVDTTAYVEDGISDILNGFTVDLEISTTKFVTSSNDGNPNPQNLKDFPIIEIDGARSVQVEIQTDCNDQCLSNLKVDTNGALSFLTAQGDNKSKLEVGVVNQVRVPLRIQNAGNNAYAARLIFPVPKNQLSYTRISNPLFTCAPSSESAQATLYSCDIGNPFREGKSEDLELTFTPSTSLSGAEGDITLLFNVTSLNEQSNMTQDNSKSVRLEVEAQADIYLDDFLIQPDQLSHSQTTVTTVVNVTQLGPEFMVFFTVGNNGPSPIPSGQLTVYWPYRPKDSKNYYLYPTSWSLPQQSTSVSVSCEETYFNQEGFNIASDDGTTESQGGSLGGGRRRRSTDSLTPKRRQRNRFITRQEQVPVSMERTISCLPDVRKSSDIGHVCVPIQCNISQLSPNIKVRIAFTAHLDERQLGGQIDSFNFYPAAEVALVNTNHITEPAGHSSNTASARLRSSPATLTVTEKKPGKSESVPWYAIVIPIVAVLILIIVVAVILYFCGFFRRKNKDELKQQAEENLAEESAEL